LNIAHARSPLDSGALVQHSAPGRAVFAGAGPELTGLLRDRPDVWVQDPASAIAVESVADLGPRVIVDLCAGRGTKTRQLAAVFPNARIAASDTDQARFAALRSLFSDSSQVSVVPPAPLREEF